MSPLYNSEDVDDYYEDKDEDDNGDDEDKDDNGCDDDVGGAARAIVEAANMDSLSLSWHWTLPTGNTIDFCTKPHCSCCIQEYFFICICMFSNGQPWFEFEDIRVLISSNSEITSKLAPKMTQLP